MSLSIHLSLSSLRRALLLGALVVSIPACLDDKGDDDDDNDDVADDDDDVSSGTDADGDGYDVDSDCDDGDSSVNPGADEVCDGVDNDCDSEIDEDATDGSPWFVDGDHDGYGSRDDVVEACDQPAGYVDNDDDCDDGDGDINPDADEVCDLVDNNCDGRVDETGETTYHEDADGDGYGDPDSSMEACGEVSGYVDNDLDCDDTDENVNPDAEEVCDDVDNDCNGAVDDDPVDGAWYAVDDDGDGLGAAGTGAFACDGVDNEWDCDDLDATEPQVVDATASASGAAGTLTKPWPTVQQGIDNASECVVVFSGTYEEAIDFGGKDLIVSGVEGAERTVIDAASLGAPAVTFAGGETAAAVLKGFTLTQGEGHLAEASEPRACGSTETCTDYYSTYCGGGIYADNSDPTLVDLLVIGNTLPPSSQTGSSDTDMYYVDSFGGGACFMNSNSSLDGVHLLGNFADQGGGAYIDEGSVVAHSRSWVTANVATDGGGFLVDGGGLLLANVGATWNVAAVEGSAVMSVGGVVNATNSTFGGNDSAEGSTLLVGASGTLNVENSIIYGEGTGYGVEVVSGTFSGEYNNVYGNTSGGYSGTTDPTGSTGNIASDPKFTSVTDDGNPSNDDWTLKSGSPSIDAGNSDSAYNDPDGTRNDQGCYGGPGGAW